MKSDERGLQVQRIGEAERMETCKSHVLVIDDDEMVLETISTVLKRSGYEVLAASNGDQGLEFARNHSITLVITDIVMPHRDGIEVILMLRKEFPDLKVIAISGGGRIGKTDYLSMAEKIGVCGVLSKPMTPDNILSLVRIHAEEPA